MAWGTPLDGVPLFFFKTQLSFSQTRSETARAAGRLADPAHPHREGLRQAVIRALWLLSVYGTAIGGPRRRDSRR